MFLLLLTLVAHCETLQPPSNPTKLASKILEQFPDYDLILHFDNTTVTSLDSIFTQRVVKLINYDLKNYEKLLNRPKGYKYLNLVLLSNSHEFKTYSSKVYNFQRYDFVVFVTREIQGDKVWTISGLERAAATLIYTNLDKRLFHCCYYCGNETGVLKETKIFNLNQLLNNYSNFNGHVFKIAYANYRPFFWFMKGDIRPQGAEGQLLSEFSRFYNFKYQLIRYQSKPGKGAWQAMVEAVEGNRVDWALGGLSMTLERGQNTDFTRFIKTQGFATLYTVYHNKWTAFENFLLVFGWTVWVIILTLTALICLVARLITPNVGFWGYAQLVLMSIVEQTVGKQIKLFQLPSLRILFLIWWLSSLSLTSVYKSQLASCLIKPSYNQPNRIDDLVKMDFSFQVNREDWSVLRENLETSSDEIYKKLLMNIRDDLGFCDAVLALDTDKIALINEENALQYAIFKRCKTLNWDYRSKLRLVNENLFPSTYHAWSMRMGSPFRLKFSETIGKMDDHGLIDHWYRSASFYRIPRSKSVSEERKALALTLTHFLPPLLILVLGLSTSFVVFVVEWVQFWEDFGRV
nr:PREDICTED: uncharacterized protein LOC107397694 [Tribolium castaneum]|eukprot:XP_015834218.1 PREDICTED: uncharacterized protein LOC107397694 [Tribolium castaneum]